MTRAVLAAVAAAGLASGAASAAAVQVGRTAACPAPRVGPAYVRRVDRALASGRDVWGERLLAARGGPSLDAARRLLPPLLYAAGPGGRRLTSSGVYYLPFTLPTSVGGARGFGLHVADGSEVIVRRTGGPHLTVGVGAGAAERFGSCLRRLAVPALAEGWLPLLETAYRDRGGVGYHQESFVGRVGRTLVSYVHVAADGRGARSGATVRLVSSRGGAVVARVPRGGRTGVYAAFRHDTARVHRIDAAAYRSARTAVSAFWRRQTGDAAAFDVPEPRVSAAERALVVQELEMTWRYSVGNTYEELSYAEALDVAQVMAGYGYADVARQILRYTLRQLPLRFTNWRAGERLVAGAQYFRLTRDTRYVAEETPRLRAVVDVLARRIAASPNGLLPRERYSSDIPDEIVSLQGQTLVWQGLASMARVWAATGRPGLAARSSRAADRLEHALRGAVRRSERRLPDGSLFVPAALLDRGAPFARLTTSRAGSYWNLVAPYALASGFFDPHGAQARGLLRYVLRHGGRLAGLVRAGAYRLTGANGAASGTDQVYGANVARFLADADRPDQIVLSLYATLAAALTPGTYVGGEAASVTPLRGESYRTMYLPPNNAAAGTFLEELRLMLVHETRDAGDAPRGLELAFATPRSWLADGKTIAVHGAPTSFGPVSYSLVRRGRTVVIDVDPPSTPAPATLRLRLRLPEGDRLSDVADGDAPVPFDAGSGTIDLSGRTAHLELTATIAPAVREVRTDR